jgi:membrane-associated phospholipid phosphatase
MSCVPLSHRTGALAWLAVPLLVVLGCSESKPPLEPMSEMAAINAAAGPAAPAALGWNELARTLVAGARMSPLAASRALALLGVAQYAAIDRVSDSSDGILPGEGFGPGGRARYESERGAVAGASRQVLLFLFPTAGGAVEDRMAVERSGAGGPLFNAAVRTGMSIGQQLVQRARNDHFTDPWTGTVPVGPGLWIPGGPPSGPLFGTVTPYFMESGDQFRPPPPPAFGSPAFLASLASVRAITDARTPQQLAIAQAWNFAPGSYTPLGYWNEVASTFIAQNRLNERAATHVYALMHAAALDALIGCWDAKYYYWFIRPYQADPAITTPIGMPAHPSYPSGHSCNSSAATLILAHFFPAQAANLAAQLAEAGVSRIYGGIHYDFDITAAVALGTSVAELALQIDRDHGLLSVLR